jgi:hypothetical protein
VFEAVQGGFFLDEKATWKQWFPSIATRELL